MSQFNPFSSLPLSTGQAIAGGTVVAGLLDATDGVVAYGLMGLNPVQVLQFIASGAFGTASFAGGLPTAGAGLLFHFFIALVVASLYIFASRAVPILNTRPVTLGLIYGALVYLAMTYIVLPQTAVVPSDFSLALFLNGVIGHALFVGLPIALFARRAR